MSPVKPLEKTVPIRHIGSRDRSRASTPGGRPDPVIDVPESQPEEKNPPAQGDGDSLQIDEYA